MNAPKAIAPPTQEDLQPLTVLFPARFPLEMQWFAEELFLVLMRSHMLTCAANEEATAARQKVLAEVSLRQVLRVMEELGGTQLYLSKGTGSSRSSGAASDHTARAPAALAGPMAKIAEVLQAQLQDEVALIPGSGEVAGLKVLAEAQTRSVGARLGGDQSFYIHSGVFFRAEIRHRQIRAEFKGNNVPQLAQKHSLTQMRIRQILAGVKKPATTKRKGVRATQQPAPDVRGHLNDPFARREP